MATLDIRPLTDAHTFGARIRGVTRDNVCDLAIGQQLRDVFEDRGMIVFEDVEQSDEMQFALSNVFGPPQDYAIKNSSVESAEHKGVIRIGAAEKAGTIVEVDGKRIAGLLSWHFDACYAEKLNRAGVLRVITNPPTGGMTGFADGIQMYLDLPTEWQTTADALSVIYYQFNMQDRQRFGLPEGYRMIALQKEARVLGEASRDIPRSVHPAVWTRACGEKVLHVSPWQADGIAGQEGADGDALLEELIQQMYAVMQPYWHDWQPGEMVIWDNWRFLHGASGYEPQYAREVRRTTIQGDYGLGSYEKDWKKPFVATV